ncbi:helix-turn-helix domain-containing protein [Bacillus cereus group sp. N6]|uniref:helix-turn-helix domain-containing protein n=1 Tax=Bacillus cereus group sp. N6 TaxID=2794583 RepID=UPI0018F6BE2B|nr:helix-turn-helix domain-containing protein [Bacillus cereus group sp. N6]MBJ8113489.1 helix-turn-helix domain-containing protein [Bacillus cereus group sp. N6]
MSQENGFSIIPNVFTFDERIGRNEFIIYGLLRTYMNNETRDCFPSIQTLCNHSGISRNTVKKTIDNLIEYGYVTREFRKTDTNHNKSNLYYVVKVGYETEVENGGSMVDRGRSMVEGGRSMVDPELYELNKTYLNKTKLKTMSFSPKNSEKDVLHKTPIQVNNALEEIGQEHKQPSHIPTEGITLDGGHAHTKDSDVLQKVAKGQQEPMQQEEPYNIELTAEEMEKLYGMPF